MKFVSAFICSTLVLILASNSSDAQTLEEMMQYNMQQQRAIEAQMNNSMAQSEMQMQQHTRNYLEANRPRLEREHQQYMQNTGARMSLEEYARSEIIAEATKRNAAMAPQRNPIFEQQQQNFRASQEAHQARQQQFDTHNNNWAQGQQQIDSNNQAWMQNQRQIDSGNSRFIQGAIQGNQYYRNSETGQVAELPFANAPGVYQNGNDDTWISPSMGQYNQVNPQGMPQQMEAFEPEYYGEE